MGTCLGSKGRVSGTSRVEKSDGDVNDLVKIRLQSRVME